MIDLGDIDAEERILTSENTTAYIGTFRGRRFRFGYDDISLDPDSISLVPDMQKGDKSYLAWHLEERLHEGADGIVAYLTKGRQVVKVQSYNFVPDSPAVKELLFWLARH